jgi:hypothetical protein
MKGKDDKLTYHLFSSGKRYFLIDSNGNMASDTRDSPEEVVQKYKNWGGFFRQNQPSSTRSKSSRDACKILSNPRDKTS